jgi:hypothetical protein
MYWSLTEKGDINIRDIVRVCVCDLRNAGIGMDRLELWAGL